MLERGPLQHRRLPARRRSSTGSSPRSARAPRRWPGPTGTDVDAFQVKGHEIQRICNQQQFGSGNRHYLGVQFTLWDGQLVITHDDHGHRAARDAAHRGHRARARPGAPAVHHQAGAQDREVAKTVRFWETVERQLPLVEPDEVVRLAVARPASPGTRRCWTSSAASWCCPSRSGCGTPGRTSPGGTGSWRTTRCAPRPRCCGWRTPRRSGCWRRTAWTHRFRRLREEVVSVAKGTALMGLLVDRRHLRPAGPLRVAAHDVALLRR